MYVFNFRKTFTGENLSKKKFFNHLKLKTPNKICNLFFNQLNLMFFRKALSAASKSSLEDEDYLDLNTKLDVVHSTEIVILGTGESGTSTLFKQFRYLTNEKNNEEITYTKNFIINNIVESMNSMVKYCLENNISINYDVNELVRLQKNFF